MDSFVTSVLCKSSVNVTCDVCCEEELPAFQVWQMQQCKFGSDAVRLRMCNILTKKGSSCSAEEKEMDLGRCFPDRTVRKWINMHCRAVSE